MNLGAICVSNGVGIFILLMLLSTSRTRTLQRRTEDKLFTFMVLGVLLACVAEMGSYLLDGKLFPGARLINYAANTYLFSVNLLLPLCVLFYVDIGLYGDTARVFRRYRPQIIVGACMFAATLLNFAVPICYVITPENVYERRPFSYAYYFVILWYCISAIVTTRRYERENGAKAFFSIHMFVLPILVGAGLQFAFYGLSLAWLAAAVGLVGLFMMQQNEMAYLDALTDTYNRQYLNHILTAWLARGNAFAGAMLDLDDFKQINDRFGHSEGDRALRTVADILKRAARDHEWVFRFAGDEFVILKMTDAAEDLTAYMAEAERLLTQWNAGEHRYRIALSYGVGAAGEGGADAFLKQMDDALYAMKAAHHAAR